MCQGRLDPEEAHNTFVKAPTRVRWAPARVGASKGGPPAAGADVQVGGEVCVKAGVPWP